MEDNSQSRPVKDLVTDTPASFRPEWNTQNVSENVLLNPNARKDEAPKNKSVNWTLNENIFFFLEVKTINSSYDQQSFKLRPILNANFYTDTNRSCTCRRAS